MTKKTILKLVPSFTAKGGISNYYKVLQGNYSVDVEYFVRGARNWPVRNSFMSEALRACFDLLRFSGKLLTRKYYVIQTTTSLGSFALVRDGLFILTAKLLRVKVVVFFRGLDEKVQQKIQQRYLRLFKTCFFLSDCIIVLSSQFKEQLEVWGYRKAIYLETTVVDEKSLDGVSTENINDKFENINDAINILFLARVEKTKGIYEAIDSFNILKSAYPMITLTIAGDGFELADIKKYVKSLHIDDIAFVGFVTGENKNAIYKKSHIYLFPSYTEGMPTSVLEAMAFGLPVVTRNVGGLVDFFKDGRHGFITESKDPAVLAKLITKLLKNKNMLKTIALTNHEYAVNRFTTSKVVERLEKIYETLQ